jgi:hypothetical protein
LNWFESFPGSMNKPALVRQIIARLMGKPGIHFCSAATRFSVKWDLQ